MKSHTFVLNVQLYKHLQDSCIKMSSMNQSVLSQLLIKGIDHQRLSGTFYRRRLAVALVLAEHSGTL